MTPVYLNLSAPSFPLTTGQKQDQNQLFDSPNNQDSTSSISCPSFFNILDQRQTRHDQEAVMDDSCNKMEDEESRSNSYRSSKWMCSEMRADSGGPASDKASNICTRPRWQHEGHRIPSNSNNSNRVCADCSTTSTPLWRSGPKGPKSLCNACGIRQRKARRATAEAANGLGATMDTKTRVHKNKENKSRANHFAQFKNKGKSSSQPHQGETRKLGFKDFSFTSAFQQVFPRDEAVEAALLLMDLSSGFIHF